MLTTTTVFEVEADDVAASLKFASARVTRSRPAESRTAGSQSAEADPWAGESSGGYSDDPPPF